jgi:hypothetical protein
LTHPPNVSHLGARMKAMAEQWGVTEGSIRWGYEYEARYMFREDPLWLLLSFHHAGDDEPIRSVHLEGRAVEDFLYELSLVLTALREGAAAHTQYWNAPQKELFSLWDQMEVKLQEPDQAPMVVSAERDGTPYVLAFAWGDDAERLRAAATQD